MSEQLLRDLARAKVAFQLRSIEAHLCGGAQSKPDQNKGALFLLVTATWRGFGPAFFHGRAAV